MAARRASRKGGGAPEPPPLPAEGEVVDLSLLDHARPPWTTRVERVDGWSLVLIAPLRADGEAFPVTPGSSVGVGWATDLGFLQATGRFRGSERDVIVLWTVDVRRVERQQRRGAYRLPLVVPVTLRSGPTELAGKLVDISEGGLRCCVPARHAPGRGDAVAVTTELSGLPPLDAEGTVVRRVDRSSSEVELAVSFRKMDADRCEELRRFIFAEQLRRRRLSA